MAVELLRGYDFIYAALNGDATLTPLVGARIYAELAPQTNTVTVYPFIVYSYLGGADLMGVGVVRIQTAGQFLVKVVDKTTTYATLRPIADRIDAILHGRHAAGGVDGQVFSCVREGVDPLPPEIDNGVQYRSIAGRYRLAIQV